MSIKDAAGNVADEIKGVAGSAAAAVGLADDGGDKAEEQQQVEEEQEEQEADVKTPATAVLEAAQPFQVEGGEGRVHQMQARHAQAAMGEAVADIKRHLARVADVRPVLRRYPYAAVGASVGVGFVAAALLIPSRQQRAAARLRALERAVRAEAKVGGKAGGAASATTPTRKALSLAWRFAKPTLLSMITGSLSGMASGSAGGAAASKADATDAPPTDAADVT